MSGVRSKSWVFLVVAVLALEGCGGGGSGSSSPPPQPHTVGGTVTGLSGTGLKVANGSDSLNISGNGAFTFATPVNSGSSFSVTITGQPATPTQTCAVVHGSGSVATTDVTNVEITCTTNSYTVGGTVSGLTGSGLVLGNNGGNNLAVNSAGAFTFTTSGLSGSTYAVSVLTPPAHPAQSCAVANASGTIGGSNVTGVTVTCTSNSYVIGGHVAGLVGSGLAVSVNGGTAVPVLRNGGFTAVTSPDGTAYTLTISAQPTNPAQTCVLTNGAGTLDGSDVDSASIYCPQAAGRFAYVTGAGSPRASPPVAGTISVYSIDAGSGTLTMVPASTVSTGGFVRTFQLVPHSNFAWAVHLGDMNGTTEEAATPSIYDYTVDASTGLLTPVSGSPFTDLDGQSTTTGCSTSGRGVPVGLTFFPGGGFGYVTNSTSSSAHNARVWRFTVDPTNGKPGFTGEPVPTGCAGPGIARLDPGGQFLYTTDAVDLVGTNDLRRAIFSFTVNQTNGGVTATAGSPLVTGASGADAVVTPDPFGRVLYHTQPSSPQIRAYRINFLGGGLTELAGSPFTTTSTGVFAITIDPRGRFAYVAAAAGIYVYPIDSATGALTGLSSGVAVGSLNLLSYFKVEIDPSGKFAYVISSDVNTNHTAVYAYTIDASTGALTPVAGSPFAGVMTTDGNPIGITITP